MLMFLNDTYQGAVPIAIHLLLYVTYHDHLLDFDQDSPTDYAVRLQAITDWQTLHQDNGALGVIGSYQSRLHYATTMKCNVL